MSLYPAQALERAMKIQEEILRAASGKILWMLAAEICLLCPTGGRGRHPDGYGGAEGGGRAARGLLRSLRGSWQSLCDAGGGRTGGSRVEDPDWTGPGATGQPV